MKQKGLVKKINHAMLAKAQGPMNIMERTKQVNELARDVYNKINLETMTAQRERELVAQTEACMYAMISRVLLFNWNDLRKKETRLKAMYQNIQEYRNGLEKPDKEQLFTEQEFCRQTGFRMTRANNPDEVLSRVATNETISNERLESIILAAGEDADTTIASDTLLCLLNELRGYRQNKEKA